MGYSSYSEGSRSVRATILNYHHAAVNDIFTQNKLRRVHESMNPKNVAFRECRDSEAHPNATPIQLYLDVTGSMGQIPHMLVKDGLPKLMSKLTQKGVADAALMFGAIGDHECDDAPLQIGQFESGDAELDMWLTRTYLEGGGGANRGESYLLAWYFGANHVVTDSFEKRSNKGYIFTIGDEPTLNSLPASAVKGIMGDTAKSQATSYAADLLESAQQSNHVFHIFVEHNGRRCDNDWRELLGQNLIITNDYTKIPDIIADTIIAMESGVDTPVKAIEKTTDKETTEPTKLRL